MPSGVTHKSPNILGHAGASNRELNKYVVLKCFILEHFTPQGVQLNAEKKGDNSFSWVLLKAYENRWMVVL